MAHHEIAIDRALPLREEPETGHNRWHPQIPPVLRCKPGDEITFHTRDALDGQLGPHSTSTDLLGIDRLVVHPLTGPVAIVGAEPGDALVVDILEVAVENFGFTAQVPGFGFLREEFPEPYLVRWRIAGGYAVSDELPGVRIPGVPFAGTIGVGPSAELLTRINRRERELGERGGAVVLPDSVSAVPGDPVIAAEGLRTTPPREIVGNVDIKYLRAGTRLFLPVWTAGALLSVGDLHFAQGDGEVCGTAIEVAGVIRLRVDLVKAGAATKGLRGLQFEGELQPTPRASRYFATTGLSIGPDGADESEDLTAAARSALLEMIDYIVAERGFTRQQAYALCSVAVDLRVNEVVNVPNFLVSALLPLDVFTDRGL